MNKKIRTQFYESLEILVYLLNIEIKKNDSNPDIILIHGIVPGTNKILHNKLNKFSVYSVNYNPLIGLNNIVRNVYNEIKHMKNYVLIGYSLGGIIALKLQKLLDIHKIILIATPQKMFNVNKKNNTKYLEIGGRYDLLVGLNSAIMNDNYYISDYGHIKTLYDDHVIKRIHQFVNDM